MSAFLTQHTAMFAAQVAMFGSRLSYNGVSVDCTTDSGEIISQVQRTNMLPVRPATFSVSREDFNSLGFKLRTVIEADGYKFEIYSFKDDSQCGCVNMKCNLKL